LGDEQTPGLIISERVLRQQITEALPFDRRCPQIAGEFKKHGKFFMQEIILGPLLEQILKRFLRPRRIVRVHLRAQLSHPRLQCLLALIVIGLTA